MQTVTFVSPLCGHVFNSPVHSGFRCATQSSKPAILPRGRQSCILMSTGAGNSGASIAVKPSIAECKKTLIAAVTGLEQGRVTLDDEKAQKEIDELIVKLEELNPTSNPADSPLRRARWRLLYTTSPIVLGRNRPGFGRPEKCWQVLDMQDGKDEGCLTNEEEITFRFLGLEWPVRNRIQGVCKALNGDRIRLKFESFRLGGWFKAPFPGNVVAWQDQTFLDDTMRIARTNFGNVFVLLREGDV